jgi:hypothetical protein
MQTTVSTTCNMYMHFALLVEKDTSFKSMCPLFDRLFFMEESDQRSINGDEVI